jgi:hypothetical protein
MDTCVAGPILVAKASPVLKVNKRTVSELSQNVFLLHSLLTFCLQGSTYFLYIILGFSMQIFVQMLYLRGPVPDTVYCATRVEFIKKLIEFGQRLRKCCLI